MAESLQYIVSLQDKVSSGLRAITISNDGLLNRFSQLQTKANEVNKTFSHMGTTVGSLKQKLELLKAEREWLPASGIDRIKTYNREIQKLESQIVRLETVGTKRSGGGMGMLGGMLPMLTNPWMLAGIAGAKAFSLGMENEMQKTKIETLMYGDKIGADALFKKIAEYGKTSPYEKTGLIRAQTNLMNGGLGDESAFAMLKKIGDVALGDEQSMNSLSLSFAKVANMGRLQGEALEMMMNAGFNPLQEISRKTGEGVDSLREKMSKGAISAKMVTDAFDSATSAGGRFYRGSERGGQTMQGKFSTLMDTISELLIQVYDLVAPVILPVIEAVGIVVGAVGDGVGFLMDMFKKASPEVQTFGNAIGYVLFPIKALAEGIIWLSTKSTGWGEQWAQVTTFAGNVFSIFVDTNRLAFKGLIDGFMIGLDNLKIGWYKTKNALGLGNTGENNVQIKALGEDVSRRLQEQANLANKIKNTAKATSLKWVVGTKSEEAGASSVSGSIAGGGKGSGLGSALEQSNESIVTGGSKSQVFNISIKEMNGIKEWKAASASMRESAEQIEEQALDALLRALGVAVNLA